MVEKKKDKSITFVLNEPEKIKSIQSSLKKSKSIPLLSEDEFRYTLTPIGNGIYTHYSAEILNKNQEQLPRKRGRPRKAEADKASPYDYMICTICGEKYTRHNRYAHNRTKIHQAYQSMNLKLAKLLFNK